MWLEYIQMMEKQLGWHANIKIQVTNQISYFNATTHRDGIEDNTADQDSLKISIAVFSTNTFLNYVLIFGKFGAPHMWE